MTDEKDGGMENGDRTLRVLIVEDESMIAMLMEDMVAELGHEVTATAGRLDEAARLATEGLFDFAILDVNLNGERTYGLADALKARGIPFVFATGYGTSGLNQNWKNAPTLQKPFQSRDLDRVMRELVRA